MNTLRHSHTKHFPFPATQRRGRIKKCPYRVATGMFDEYAERSRNNRCRNVKGKEKKKTDRQERKGQGNSGHAGCRRGALCRPAKRAGTPRVRSLAFSSFLPFPRASFARPRSRLSGARGKPPHFIQSLRSFFHLPTLPPLVATTARPSRVSTDFFNPLFSRGASCRGVTRFLTPQAFPC